MIETRTFTLTADREILQKIEDLFNSLVYKPVKDYIILSFRMTKYSAYPGTIWDRDEKGLFGVVGMMHWCTEESMLDGNTNKEIYSIKRLGDNEMFTVGDKIYHSNTNPSEIGVIKSMYIHKDYGIVFKTEGAGEIILKFARKSKASLFITEDGVEKYKDDEVWEVREDWSLVKDKVYKYGENGSQATAYNWKFFDKKEDAEKYIEENKKQFSKKDILKAIEEIHSIFSEYSYRRLKEKLGL